MSTRSECDVCGIAACDLPDGQDPDLFFEYDDDGRMKCMGCTLFADGAVSF